MSKGSDYLDDLQELITKIEHEGGLGDMLFYQGPEILHTYPGLGKDFADKWRELYGKFMEIADILDECSEE